MQQPAGTILVVDDEQANTELLSRRLERHHYAVDTASSGREALSMLSLKTYDATLLDLMMPDLDGLGVLREMRASADQADTPVIMVTARSDPDDVARALESGADDFVSKPIDFRVLLARLHVQVARRRAQLDLARLNAQLAATVAESSRYLEEMESQLATVAENLPLVLWRLQRDEHGSFNLLFQHGAVQAVLGDAQPPIGEHLDGLLGRLHDADRQPMRLALERLVADNAPLELDVRLDRQDGPRWVHMAARVSRTDPRHIDGAMLDVHDRKLLEAQLLQTQKLESVGQLAAGIAHEINSPAQYTRDNVAFLKESFTGLTALLKAEDALLEQARSGPLDPERFAELDALREAADLEFVLEEVPPALEQSLDGIDRISRIVTAMKGFTHPGGETPESCDLNKLMQDTATVARNEYKYVAELTQDLDPALPYVSCFPSELGQVVLNLVVNAAHAIGDARRDGDPMGSIRLTTRHLAAQDRVEIRVADDGPGVPAELCNRIFDPFFTTKAVGKGTGQGLAIAHSIVVDKHGGELTLDDTEPHGATFVISLPCGGKTA